MMAWRHEQSDVVGAVQCVRRDATQLLLKNTPPVQLRPIKSLFHKICKST